MKKLAIALIGLLALLLVFGCTQSNAPVTSSGVIDCGSIDIQAKTPSACFEQAFLSCQKATLSQSSADLKMVLETKGIENDKCIMLLTLYSTSKDVNGIVSAQRCEIPQNVLPEGSSSKNVVSYCKPVIQ